MATFIRNKRLYTLDDNNNYQPFYTVENEVFLTADPIEGLFSFEDYFAAVTSPFSKKVPRLYLLNNDETIKQDVTEYITACNATINYTQGQTRSASLTLLNTDGVWTPNPVKGFLWKGTKFRLDVGLYHNGTIFWGKFGILTPANPTVNDDAQTVQFDMYDKFALLDGTIGGTIDSDLKIPVGTPLYTAIESCLSAQKENGDKYDSKPIIFPMDKYDVTTPYTISKSPGLTYGELIIELANIISCDVSYNADGNLTLIANTDELSLADKTVLWNFDDTTQLYTKPNFVFDLSKVVNKVSVYGAISNGYRFKGVAINTNAASPTNIYMTEPNPEYIEDTNIASDALCEERARYELQKKTLLALQVKFDCVFIPILAPNNLVTWTSKKHGFLNEKFFINSVSFDVLEPGLMNLSLSNVREVMIR